MEYPLKELLLESGMLSFGPRGPGPHRRLKGSKLWYFQHGDFHPTNPDGLAMSEINLPYQHFDVCVNVAVMAREFADALDKEAKLHGDFSNPGAKFRHANDPDGDRGMSISCLNLVKAFGLAGPPGMHHNAGVDARYSLVSVLAMMVLYPGVQLPCRDHTLPVLVAIDFERGYNPHAREGCVTEVGVSVFDVMSFLNLPEDLDTVVKTYHTLVEGREDFHPSRETEIRMGIPEDPALKPRVWFFYGPNPELTRNIQARIPKDGSMTEVAIGHDTDTTPVDELADWITFNIDGESLHGSTGFPTNPPERIAWQM